MIDFATSIRQQFIRNRQALPEPVNLLEIKRQEAIQWLKDRGIYRGDLDCAHSYRPVTEAAIEQAAASAMLMTHTTTKAWK